LVWSHVYESGRFRYGTLMYKGDPEVQEVLDAYQRDMPRENWIYDETLRTADTVVRYVKRNGRTEHCDIAIGTANWLGNRYVILTVTGSHAE